MRRDLLLLGTFTAGFGMIFQWTVENMPTGHTGPYNAIPVYAGPEFVILAFSVILLGALIALYGATSEDRSPQAPASADDQGRRALNQRYIAGELTREQYFQMRDDLRA